MHIITHIHRPFPILLTVLFLLYSVVSSATVPGGPVAFYSFNAGTTTDEITGRQARAYHVDLWEDRFGNPDMAVYFRGNKNSYINLGTSEVLKPQSCSISLWVNVLSILGQGKGVEYNPIISTKASNSFDCCEAYSMYIETVKPYRFGACHQASCSKATNTAVNDKITLGAWYHLAITYDNGVMCLYQNGELQQCETTGFEASYLLGDSVLLGYYNNIKNIRFFRGVIDDVALYDRVLKPAEIKALYNAPDPNRQKVILRRIMFIVAVLLVMLITFFLIRYYIRVSIKKGKERLELSNKLLENELRINRALMNPHFIFNSMSTLHNYILHRDTEKAEDYLVKFSRLIRKILESNLSDTITLDMEVDLLERYIGIECLRFKEHIVSRVVVEPPLLPSATVIPIMMVQPFVENAIWHGLSRKNGQKELLVTFSLYHHRYVKCVIEDNGVGRNTHKNTVTDKSSLATNFIFQRIELLNKIHYTHASLDIADKPGYGGTIITLVLPILNN